MNGFQTERQGDRASDRETRCQGVRQRDKVTGFQTERQGDRVSNRETRCKGFRQRDKVSGL